MTRVALDAAVRFDPEGELTVVHVTAADLSCFDLSEISSDSDCMSMRITPGSGDLMQSVENSVPVRKRCVETLTVHKAPLWLVTTTMVASFAAMHGDMNRVSVEAGNGSVLCVNIKLTRPQSTHARTHCGSWMPQWTMWVISLLLLLVISVAIAVVVEVEVKGSEVQQVHMSKKSVLE